MKSAFAGVIARLGIIAAAVALAAITLPPYWVETWYSSRIYPVVEMVLTPISNLFPFALGDLMVVLGIPALLVWWALRLARARRGERLRALGWLVLNTGTAGALLYIAFLALWGLNYQREPLGVKLDYAPQRVTRAAELELLQTTIEQLNRDAPLVHGAEAPADEAVRAELYPAYRRTLTELGTGAAIVPANPKTSLMDAYFEATGVTGFTDPITHEVILTASLLPVEKPFVLAHEWGHLAGYASEDEANFIALLSCLHSDQPFIRYSGWLELYMYLPPDPSPHTALSPLVESDLQAVRERVLKTENKQVSRAERKAYDGFLKANRVEAGIGSYGLFVRLLLGTHFDPGWVPVMQ